MNLHSQLFGSKLRHLFIFIFNFYFIYKFVFNTLNQDCEPDDWTRYNMMNMRKNGYFEIRWPKTVLSYLGNILHINGPVTEVEEAHRYV